MSERMAIEAQARGRDAPRAVVIGGGATGCGVARDLCQRGFQVTLVEFGDLGSGTSARFHGMLQSGARYAVSDRDYAAECMRERSIIAGIAPQAVEQTGGLFVSLEGEPSGFGERFREACLAAEIPVEECDPGSVMDEEPAISRRVRRAFAVPDATIQPWILVNLLAADVRRMGGRVLTRHQVQALEIAGERLTAVRVIGEAGEQRLPADVVVNAAGPWSGRVAALAGLEVALELTKGSLLVFAHRLVRRAINRCRPASSHDIIVPTGTVSLFGTTSEVVSDPDTTWVKPSEVQALLEGAEPLVPGVRGYRVLRAWAGVRPLVKPDAWRQGEPLPRRHAVIDHRGQGLTGLFTVCGGSLSTHRSMAEDVSDRVCASFGINQPCRTATTPIAVSGSGGPWRPAAGHARIVGRGGYDRPLCDCEAVEREQVEKLIDDEGLNRLHDLRRRLRIGFGPCQGTFCGSRLAALLARLDRGFGATEALERFWIERLKGSLKTAWGDQARQALLSDTVYREILGLRLPRDLTPTVERR